MTAYWVSSPKMTIRVAVESPSGLFGQTILEAAPIAKKFIGQPFGNLLGWMAKQGRVDFRIIR